MSENVPQRSTTDRVKITIIIVAGVIIFACIVGFVVITTAFFLNPPW
jgi:hypothetical protein